MQQLVIGRHRSFRFLQSVQWAYDDVLIGAGWISLLNHVSLQSAFDRNENHLLYK